MRTCQACGREFVRKRHHPMACIYCGYNNAPGGMPRSLASLQRMEVERQAERDKQTEREREADPE